MPASKNISFDELAQYFHLPINQVAKELGICATILKKTCRKNGIPRWPHRKIKSLDNRIANLQVNLDKNPQDRDDIAKEINLLQAKKGEIMKHPDIIVRASRSSSTISTEIIKTPSPRSSKKKKLKKKKLQKNQMIVYHHLVLQLQRQQRLQQIHLLPIHPLVHKFKILLHHHHLLLHYLLNNFQHLNIIILIIFKGMLPLI